MKQFCACLGMMGEQDVGKDGGASRSILGDRPALSRAAYKGSRQGGARGGPKAGWCKGQKQEANLALVRECTLGLGRR